MAMQDDWIAPSKYVAEPYSGERYESADAAAIAWSEANMPLSMQGGIEYGGIVYSFDLTYSDGTSKTLYAWTGSIEGFESYVEIGNPYKYLPKGAKLEAVVHSHGKYFSGVEYFSGSKGDKGYMDYWNVPVYMCYQGELSPLRDPGGGLISDRTDSTHGTVQVILPDKKLEKAPIYGAEAYIGELVGFFSWDALPPIK